MQVVNGFERSENCHTCKFRNRNFFCQLDRVALKEFDAIKSLSIYPTDAVLFVEREDPRGIFVLCEGCIKLSMCSEEGKTLIMRIAKPGEVLGLMATVSGIPYEVTAETLRPSQVAFVRRTDFLNFINRHPENYRSVINHIASSYGDVCEQLRVVGLSSIPKRLAKVLLDWSDEAGGQSRASSRISIHLTQEEIGEFIGSARETVTRTLRDFENCHLITVRGGRVTIHDRKGLERAAGGLIRVTPPVLTPSRNPTDT